MTTNFEWLCENDRETLMQMIVGDCSECNFDEECENFGYQPVKCSRDWLNAEYEEPDSWKKIEEECEMDSWEYCSKYSLTRQSDGPILPNEYAPIRMKKHLVSRCKNLAGVE